MKDGLEALGGFRKRTCEEEAEQEAGWGMLGMGDKGRSEAVWTQWSFLHRRNRVC